jgi:hypothetical protein
MRIEVLEFDASVRRREPPVSLGVLFVALSLPGGNLLGKELFVGDPAVEALGGRTPSSDSAKSSQLPCLGV